ncbi:MAG: M50 family metallopeptidase, partial [Actinomycetota bacterium]|nr:M50 family metallopeptidase [Actinomycetota bacterium]
ARWRPPGSETEYAIGAIPAGGYVKISGMNPHEELPAQVAHRAYYRQKVWKRVVVIGAGPVVNIVLAFLMLWVLLVAHGAPVPVPVVHDVSRGTPAAHALHPGDRLLSVDRVRGFSPRLSVKAGSRRVERMRSVIGRARCAGPLVNGCTATEPVRLTVLRGGARRAITLHPRYDAKANRFVLGFRFGQRPLRVGAGRAVSLSGAFLWYVTRTTVDRIVRLFYDKGARKDVSGVVGSYERTRQSFDLSTWQAVQILALISLSLGVINLFPFLPLDGGHIFWAVAEKVRGRPIPFGVMERAGVVGFMLVLFLFYVGLSNDIGRLTSGEGFGGP